MRKGVECKFCGEDELDDFMELMKETGRRDGFEIRSEEYFRNFYRHFTATQSSVSQNLTEKFCRVHCL